MTLPDWLLLIIMPLGVLRGVILVMNDEIISEPRDWLKRHLPAKLRFSLECPWCTGLQVSLITCALLAWDFSRPLTMWLLVAGSVSIFTVIAERMIDRVPLFMDKAPPGTLPEHHADRPPDAVRAALDSES